MTSILGFALLGVLAREPATGYELAKRLADPVDYFWSARHSQIYPELARLTRDGLVWPVAEDGPGPRTTKRYSVTDIGRDALRSWAVSELGPARERDEFLLRVYSLWLADPVDVRVLVAGERARHAERLATYAALADEVGAPVDVFTPVGASAAALVAGLSYERHRVDYCDWLLSRLPPAEANERA